MNQPSAVECRWPGGGGGESSAAPPPIFSIDSNVDALGYRAVARACAPELAAAADLSAVLVEAVRECARLAEATGKPADKVAHLKAAKWGLARLRAYVAALPASADGRLKLMGFDQFGDRLQRLEILYRAFGWIPAHGR